MVAISTLANISRASFVTLQAISASEENAWSNRVISAVNNLNSVAPDIEDHWASASAPLDQPAGKRWFDSGNSIWKGFKTLAGTPVTFLESGATYARSLSNAGTATEKPNGALDSNTTQVISPGTGNPFMSYTVPANTILNTGSILDVMGVFVDSAGGAAISYKFGGTSDGLAAGYVNGIQIYKVRLVSGGSGSFKAASYFKNGSDAIGGTMAKVFTGTDSLTSDEASRFMSGSGGATSQEIMITEMK